jgi:hypothetical protein
MYEDARIPSTMVPGRSDALRRFVSLGPDYLTNTWNLRTHHHEMERQAGLLDKDKMFAY